MEQDLESSKEKVVLLSRENHNLQEELSEAYRLKVFSNLLPDQSVLILLQGRWALLGFFLLFATLYYSALQG